MERLNLTDSMHFLVYYWHTYLRKSTNSTVCSFQNKELLHTSDCQQISYWISTIDRKFKTPRDGNLKQLKNRGTIGGSSRPHEFFYGFFISVLSMFALSFKHFHIHLIHSLFKDILKGNMNNTFSYCWCASIFWNPLPIFSHFIFSVCPLDLNCI